jgi:hypothetical protein
MEADAFVLDAAQLAANHHITINVKMGSLLAVTIK